VVLLFQFFLFLVRFAEGCPPSAKLSIAADYAGVNEPYLGWRAFHAPRVLENLYLAIARLCSGSHVWLWLKRVGH